MAPAPAASPAEHDSIVRKRVGKACDRCRMKKSKCDGNSPCSRCVADGSPSCSFGERKKSHRVCPDGYVDWLEQQQIQLVNGCQELYRRLLRADAWEGSPLPTDASGKPATHHILDRLGVLLHPDAGSPNASFDDDVESMRQKLVGAGPEYLTRCASPASMEAENDVVDRSFSRAEPASGFASAATAATTTTNDQLPTPPMHLSPPPPPRTKSPRPSRIHSKARVRPKLSLSRAGYGAALHNHLARKFPTWDDGIDLSNGLDSVHAPAQAQVWVDSPALLQSVDPRYMQCDDLPNPDYNNNYAAIQCLQRPISAEYDILPMFNDLDYNDYLDQAAYNPSIS